MFDAQILMSDGTTSSVYSPWFPRSADNARFSIEVLALNGTDLKVEIFTKNNDETTNGAAISGASATISAAEVGTITVAAGATAIKELVRYKFTINPATSGKWAMFRVLPTVWYDTEKA